MKSKELSVNLRDCDEVYIWGRVSNTFQEHGGLHHWEIKTIWNYPDFLELAVQPN
jgi:hypothetical protein